jgi:nitric oxide dioxygenase
MTKKTVSNLFKMMEFPKEGVFSKVLAKGESSNHTLMCLAKGTDISEHTSTKEAVVTVLKGTRVEI